MTRLYADGRKLPAQARDAQRVRGQVAVQMERVDGQHLLVARITELERGAKPVPALFEVVPKPTFGASWVIAGHERKGSTEEEIQVRQVWLVTCAAAEALKDLEAKLADKTKEAYDMWLQLAVAKHGKQNPDALDQKKTA